jgi:hypothetical protein
MNLQLFRDEDGYARAATDEEFAPLGWFLEQDVQADPIYCQQLIAICDGVLAGGGEWSATGNAHTITISADGATIENEFVLDDSGGCTLAVRDLRQALEAWLTHISREPSP